MPEGKKIKVYVATLDNTFAKWFLKIFLSFPSSFWLTLTQQNIQLNAKPLLNWLPLIALSMPHCVK